MPQRVTEEFLERMRFLVNASPSELPADETGLVFVIDVDDPQPNDSGYDYMFELHIRRNDTDFWVADIDCTALTGDNEVAWSSKQIRM